MTDDVRGIRRVPFREEELALFAAPSHPLARPGGIRFEQLEGHLILMKEEGSSTHALIRKAFERRGMVPNVLVETSNLEFIKEMVEKGDGVSFLVRSAIADELDNGRVVVIPVVDEKLALHVHIACLEGGDLSPAAAAFLKILEEEKASFGVRQKTKGAVSSRAAGPRAAPPRRHSR